METGHKLEGEDGAVDAKRGCGAWSPQRRRGCHAVAGVVTTASTRPRAQATSWMELDAGWLRCSEGATRVVGARSVSEPWCLVMDHGVGVGPDEVEAEAKLVLRGPRGKVELNVADDEGVVVAARGVARRVGGRGDVSVVE